ncbi:hypothetical protein V1291_004689 [Nitrobacteraceae bacterium AZCC 1564]
MSQSGTLWSQLSSASFLQASTFPKWLTWCAVCAGLICVDHKLWAMNSSALVVVPSVSVAFSIMIGWAGAMLLHLLRHP